MLNDLDAALAEARWADALAHALDAWRVHRDPRLADLVDALDGALPEESGRHAAQLRRAPVEDEARHPTNPERWAAWHAMLAALPPDPRTSAALGRLVAAPPHWVRGAVFDARFDRCLEAHADVRVRPLLVRHPRGSELARAVDDAAKLFPPLADARADTWLALARALTPTRGELLDRLLHAVHAEPEDLGAREVYADALMEADDPRGTFMALSLAEGRGEPGDPELLARLLVDHERAWLGEEIAALLTRRIWRNGMLDEASLVAMDQVTVDSVRRDARLSTLRVLENGTASAQQLVTFAAMLPNLRVLVHRTQRGRRLATFLEKLAAARLAALEELVIEEPLPDGVTLPGLRVRRL